MGPIHTHELSDTEMMRGAYGEDATGVRIEPFAGEPLVDYNCMVSLVSQNQQVSRNRKSRATYIVTVSVGLGGYRYGTLWERRRHWRHRGPIYCLVEGTEIRRGQRWFDRRGWRCRTVYSSYCRGGLTAGRIAVGLRVGCGGRLEAGLGPPPKLFEYRHLLFLLAVSSFSLSFRLQLRSARSTSGRTDQRKNQMRRQQAVLPKKLVVVLSRENRN